MMDCRTPKPPSDSLGGRDDVGHLNMVMRRIIGKKYPELMKHARLNCLDAAVDIHGLDLSTTLVQYQYATKHTVFGKRLTDGSVIETYNFGSLKSAYMTTVYSKHIEKVHRAIINLFLLVKIVPILHPSPLLW